MIKSISADNGKQLTNLIDDLGIERYDIIQIVWAGNQMVMFYDEH